MAVTFDKAGSGFINDGKNGKYIKMKLNDDVKVGPGDQLYLFPNDKKKSDASPDYYVNIKRGTAD